jgi:hypothetical protein
VPLQRHPTHPILPFRRIRHSRRIHRFLLVRVLLAHRLAVLKCRRFPSSRVAAVRRVPAAAHQARAVNRRARVVAVCRVQAVAAAKARRVPAVAHQVPAIRPAPVVPVHRVQALVRLARAAVHPDRAVRPAPVAVRRVAVHRARAAAVHQVHLAPVAVNPVPVVLRAPAPFRRPLGES